jgi:hypothetical protein
MSGIAVEMKPFEACCNPNNDPSHKGFLWRCPHGEYWYRYGEGQPVWVTITLKQYNEIAAGADPQVVLRTNNKKAS